MPILGRKAKFTPWKEEEDTPGSIEKVRESIAKQKVQLEDVGVPIPKKKEKAGILERVSQVLRVAEPAPYIQAIRKGKSPLKVLGRQAKRAFRTGILGKKPEYRSSLQEKIDTATFSDVMDDMGWEADSGIEKFGRAVVGLGLDIFADPKTYLTFGAARAGKLFVPKKGLTKLNDIGENLLKKATKDFGEEAGRKWMATEVSRTGSKYIGKKGLKFMGKEVLPKSFFKKPIKFIDEAFERIPGLGRLYRGVKSWGQKAFNPWNKIEKLPKGISDKFKKIAFGYTKGTKAAQQRAINEIRLKALKSSDEAGEYLGRKLPQYIERGGNVTGDDVMDNIVKWFGREHDNILKAERRAGMNIGEIENYITHYLGKGGKKYMDKSDELGRVVRAVNSISKSKPGFAKGRKLLGSINEINKKMKPVLDDMGIKGDFFEKDAFKLLAKRKTDHIQAMKTLNFFDEISERFGYKSGQLSDDMLEELKATAATPGATKGFVRDGIKYVEANMDIFKGARKLKNIYLPKPIIKHMKNVHAVISGKDDPTNAFIKAYDKILEFWKKNVTGWFPAFHSRNMIGGTFNNWLAGVKSPVWYKKARDIVRYKKLKQLGKEIPDDLNTTLKIAGKEMNFDDLIKKAQDAQVFTMPGYADVMRTMDDRIKAIERVKGAKGLKELFTTNAAVKELGALPQKGFEAVESQLRLPLFLHRLNKGDDVYSAAKQVYKFHFDYAPEALTSFERKGLKRVIPFYCVPTDSEILTKEGWKTYNELQVGEMVMGYDKDNDKYKWTELEDVATFDYNGILMGLKRDKSHDEFLFTPDHRWAIRDRQNNRKIKRGYELRTNHRIPVAGDFEFPENSKFTPREAKIIGWLVTDGHMRMRTKNGPEWVIYQSPKKHAKEIRGLLGDNLSSESSHPDNNVIQFRLKSSLAHKLIKKGFKKREDLSGVIGKLNKESAKVMWNAMYKADGTESKKGGEFLAAENEYVRNGAQMLSQMLGKPLRLNKRGGYVGKFKNQKIANNLFTTNYKGKIWCPKTKTGTWVMRRNGSPITTGNTWTRHNTPLQFEMLTKQPGKFAAAFKFLKEIDAMSGTEKVKKERENMPGWMQEMFTLRMPFNKNSGEPYYLQLDLPMEDLNKLNSREITSLLSPLLKYPIERIANKNIYFDNPIYNKNLPREYQLSNTMNILKKLPKPVKDFLNIQEVKQKNYYTGEFEPRVMMDSRAMHFVRSLWMSRWYSTFERAFEPDTPFKEKASRLVMGEPLRPLDVKRSEWRKQKERNAMLRDYLYYMKRTKRIPYASEDKEDFMQGTDIPKDTFMRKLGKTILRRKGQ